MWRAGLVNDDSYADVEEDCAALPFPADVARHALDSSTRTIITPEGWKLCLSDRDKHQLFNLGKDPWEMTNLYYTGKHTDIIRQLTAKIQEWQRKVEDTTTVAS